jgi:hypothetical protein
VVAIVVAIGAEVVAFVVTTGAGWFSTGGTTATGGSTSASAATCRLDLDDVSVLSSRKVVGAESEPRSLRSFVFISAEETVPWKKR